MLYIDYVSIERAEIEETGEYNLDGLFVRLEYAINSIKAKRVVLDTIESLFSALTNDTVLRAELRRLFTWLKEKGVTAIITGERGKEVENITRHGLEEYVADCVIVLDHTVNERIATRRMRVVKYRGSRHVADEYPFLIDENGISVLPITSLTLDHKISSQRISSGIERLDKMLDGKGFFRGTSILVSGMPGTGKSTLGASFAISACEQNEKVLYFAFEEAPLQIVRNMQSVGLNLQKHINSGLLKIDASRPTAWGLELHLASMHKSIITFKPHVVIVDPISNLSSIGSENEVRSMLIRLVDFIKSSQITALFTDLISGGVFHEAKDAGISSLMDTWILLKTFETNGERNRGIYILKSRGMNHSNQVREFLLTSKGIDIVDVYTGPEGILTGSARVAQESIEKANQIIREQESDRKERELKRKEKFLESQIENLREQFEAEKAEILKETQQQKLREEVIDLDRKKILKIRQGE